MLETVGKKCIWIQENLVHDVKVKFIEADEIWSFVAMKDRTKKNQNITDEKIGSAYTFTCIDADSKLIVAWHLGNRTEEHAFTFLRKIRGAVDRNAVFQISTDACPGYKHTVPIVFSTQAHYGQVIKTYGTPNPAEARYSPAECTGCKKKKIMGSPIKKNNQRLMLNARI